MSHESAVSTLIGAGFAVDATVGTRALYSCDASLQRVVPAAVAKPTTVNELIAVIDAARAAGIPVTGRGAGTSIAGNAIGPGLVIDTRALNRISQLDGPGRAASVEPGVVAAALTKAASAHGLRFGPDPSTVDRCTIGGMIGNNACGARALGYGRTADNLLGLDVVTGTGERLSLTSGEQQNDPSSPTLRALHALVLANLATIRTEFGRFSRQVSGYALEHLLPEHGFDVTRFLAGSEGTLALITGARVRLVPEPDHSVLVAIGYSDMAAAADAVPAVLGFHPTAVEGLDRRMVDVIERRHGVGAVPRLPSGDGWLLIELTDTDPPALADRAHQLLVAADGIDGEVVRDSSHVSRLWQIRADGAGLAATGLSRPAHSGWEDSAVPPSALGSYLRELETLLGRYGLHGLPYGHFGEGCVHLRIDFDLSSQTGVAAYRDFVEEAATLVAGYGGSISGEHGDGRARSELLGKMYSPAALALFAAVKQIFDPKNLLNPGILVDPRPLDGDLWPPSANASGLDSDFAAQVHRCTGIGKCLAPGGVMCPSYQATGQEQDSTRGRARTLQEMANGTLVRGGWASPQVREVLELCLSCKACASECPTGTDIAKAKSQVLSHAYRGRLRPRSHYTLGRLPTWSRLITTLPGVSRLMNAVAGTAGLGRITKWAAGIDPRRSVPKFANRPVRSRRFDHTSGAPVVIWVDSFTDTLDANRIDAVVALLEQAGFAPSLLKRTACCGLPWITTGQRQHAARLLRHSLELLHPIIATGTPVLGLEPSCVAVWRSDAGDLIDDPRLEEVANGVVTLAELLATTNWTPPDLRGLRIVAQPHCHHSSVLGWQHEEKLLSRTGAEVITVEGCCGMAGNFGVEVGHYETSVAIAKNQLLPAIDAAGAEAVLLADGFSCRYQIADLIGRPALTLAQLLTHSPRPTASN